MTQVVRVGTRASRLALAQTDSVLAALRRVLPDLSIEIVPIRTEGDRVQSVTLPGWGTGVFVRDIESALLNGDIDIAVHSMKDVPPVIPDALTLTATPPRADHRDVFLARGGGKFDSLPPGARIGTSSQRRAAFLRAARPDLEFVPIRGNVDTRISKLYDQPDMYDAIVLAAAGLDRLDIRDYPFEFLEPDLLLPAPGQGTLAIETRVGDELVAELVSQIDDPATHAAAIAERALVRDLDSGCRLPVGALATVDGQALRLVAAVASLDGRRLVRDAIEGRADEAEQLGARLASRRLEQGAGQLVEAAEGAA